MRDRVYARAPPEWLRDCAACAAAKGPPAPAPTRGAPSVRVASLHSPRPATPDRPRSASRPRRAPAQQPCAADAADTLTRSRALLRHVQQHAVWGRRRLCREPRISLTGNLTWSPGKPKVVKEIGVQSDVPQTLASRASGSSVVRFSADDALCVASFSDGAVDSGVRSPDGFGSQSSAMKGARWRPPSEGSEHADEGCAEWLRGVGFGEYAGVFSDHGWRLGHLHHATESDLIAMGIQQVGARRGLLHELHARRPAPHVAQPAAAAASYSARRCTSTQSRSGGDTFVLSSDDTEAAIVG
eukprot:TRINITY_DN29149_c0_g1_i1.p1 TRINITY_DN29149_c0_g1~~TRINITY_DN29149_c0_g1_i1.p1  ORF type:complete len:299 (+),score=53.17 TRINITY_DN29149_c0_g1_i1:49-945(+)